MLFYVCEIEIEEREREWERGGERGKEREGGRERREREKEREGEERERGREGRRERERLPYPCTVHVGGWVWHLPYLVMTFGSPMSPHKSHFLIVCCDPSPSLPSSSLFTLK